MAELANEVKENLLDYVRLLYPSRKHVTILDLARITDGWETEVYSFILEYESNGEHHSDDLILRIYPGDNAEEKSTKEFKVMAKLHDLGFPVPRVYYLGTDQSIFGKPFVMMEKISGQSMGKIIEASSENTRKDMIELFCKIFVDLHGLDVEPFISDPSIATDPSAYDTRNPYDYITNLLSSFRRVMARFQTEGLALALFNRLICWLEERRQSVPCQRLSLVHFDYHPFNILIKDDGTPFVIDWTNAAITDYRVDLAWTLLLVSTYGNSEMRDYILETYERIAGSKVRTIEYFEVIAATRRLGSIYLSLSAGAEKLGMRPEAVEIMKQEKEHIRNVIRILHDKTGIAVREFNELLGL